MTTTAVRLITGRDFAERLGLSRTSFHTRRALGRIGPRPVKTLGHPRWNEQEVTAWMDTPNAAGELYDAATWPAVWKQLRKR